jgi:hypothetical protein
MTKREVKTMTKRNHRKRGGLAALALAALTLPGQLGDFGWVGATAAAECEGTACQQVTLTFDEARQQYRARNNSADRWARVSASNLAAAASACLAPGAAEYLPLKSVVAPYRAEFAEPRCGAPDSYEPPPAH